MSQGKITYFESTLQIHIQQKWPLVHIVGGLETKDNNKKCIVFICSQDRIREDLERFLQEESEKEKEVNL